MSHGADTRLADLVPTGPTTTDELKGALGSILGSAVESLDARPYAYQTSHALHVLDVTLAGGERVHLLLKDLGAPSAAAFDAKPSFLREPVREIVVYEELLAGRELGTASCYGAVVDPDRGRYWLFLEHVPGLELWQVGELSVWQQVARSVARLHTACVGVDHARLLRYDRALYETWLDRALASPAGGSLRALAGTYEAVVRRLLDLPATFIHGELYPSNVLVDAQPADTRVCPIDWEMAARGPALLDLAALTAGDWTGDEREQILLAYHEAAPSGLSVDDFLEACECCRLHVALQWLGWARDWSPPKEHARDWLAEAFGAAANLGLV